MTNNYNYKCPKCGGEFDSWDSITESGVRKRKCPFCRTEKGEYNSAIGGLISAPFEGGSYE